MGHDGNSPLFFTTRPWQTRALCARDSVTILWLERASLSRVLCQTGCQRGNVTMSRCVATCAVPATMQMELKSDCQRENTSFSFRCGVNESVRGSWDCHVCCARLLTVDACPCCLLLSVIRHFFFSAVCILTRSRIVRGPVVCSARECSQQGRWLLVWSRFGQCCCGVSRTSCRVVVSRVQTLHLCSSET